MVYFTIISNYYHFFWCSLVSHSFVYKEIWTKPASVTFCWPFFMVKSVSGMFDICQCDYDRIGLQDSLLSGLVRYRSLRRELPSFWNLRDTVVSCNKCKNWKGICQWRCWVRLNKRTPNTMVQNVWAGFIWSLFYNLLDTTGVVLFCWLN